MLNDSRLLSVDREYNHPGKQRERETQCYQGSRFDTSELQQLPLQVHMPQQQQRGKKQNIRNSQVMTQQPEMQSHHWSLWGRVSTPWWRQQTLYGSVAPGGNRAIVVLLAACRYWPLNTAEACLRERERGRGRAAPQTSRRFYSTAAEMLYWQDGEDQWTAGLHSVYNQSHEEAIDFTLKKKPEKKNWKVFSGVLRFTHTQMDGRNTVISGLQATICFFFHTALNPVS